jgi:hypothetical protein
MKTYTKKIEILNARTVLFLLFFLTFSLVSVSQQPNLGESDVITKAKSLFDKKDYQGAMPLFAQLVSVHPENAEYNYCFGVCTLFGDRKDKKKPIRYLNNAVPSMKDNQDLNYYLGLAYHQNQEFANAMKYFNLYLSKLSSNAPERALILEKVNACLNGLSLIDKNLISEQVSKSNFQKDNFHRGYSADDLPGSLVLKPEIFQTEKDKKNGEISFVLLTQPQTVLCFSGYESNSSDNLDIFCVTKNPKGEWGLPEKLDETINTSYDENYPVLSDNGNILYFCSRGHNSLGGYDIYRSKYDEASKKFGPPENLGPGINSPFDDVLFIPSKDQNFAWFSSDRDNLNNSIAVFKVRLVDDPFHEKQSLAMQSSDGSSGLNINEVVSNNPEETNTKINNQQFAQNNSLPDNRSDASKKGAYLMNDRAKSALLTDSVFSVIAQIKDQVRELTNKRDRANTISQRKSSEAKELELRFDSEVAALALIKDKQQFETDLEKTVKLKEEILQLYRRADQANKIALILGNQMKFKNEEQIVLKNSAAKIQTSSLTGTYEETLVLFNGFMNHTTTADTLRDFSTQLVSITNNEVLFELPDKEFAFADNLRKAFYNNSLLAELNTQKKPIQENVPIVIVDKQTKPQEVKSTPNIPLQTTFVPYTLIDPIAYQEKEFLTGYLNSEQLDIGFAQDNSMKPLALVEPVLNNTGSPNIMTGDVGLEVNFNADGLSPYEIQKVVQTVGFDDLAYVSTPAETDIQVNFNADGMTPETLISPVISSNTITGSLIPDERIEISFFNDEMRQIAANVVQPVIFQEQSLLNSLKEESIEISSGSDQVAFNEISPDVVQVDFNEGDFFKLPEMVTLEINFGADQITPEKTTEPVYANYKDVINQAQDELVINIEKAKSDSSSAIQNTEPVQPLFAGNTSIADQNMDINFSTDQPEQVQSFPLVEEVNPENFSHGFYIAGQELELSFAVDATNPIKIVDPITTNAESLSFISDPWELEINFSTDASLPAQILKTVEPVMLVETAVNTISGEESIDIAYISDGIEALKLVSPVSYLETGSMISESNAEIRFDVDQSAKYDVTQNVVSTDYNTPANSEITGSIELVHNELLKTNQVVPVEYSSNPDNWFNNDEILEITYYTDFLPVTDRVIDPVSYSMNYRNGFDIDQNLDISFNVDGISGIQDISDAGITSISAKKSGETAPLQTCYLRASILPSGVIESSISDLELLKKALINPDELSYEELLYAASLANNPADKLAIYNVAFVHIDRDWRAFNNAAIPAIQNENLNQADCYLYQASLLSSDNPQIKNNMGILACHQKNYAKAEEYFIAASSLGYDSQYNLQVIENLEKIINDSKNEMNAINQASSKDIIVQIIGDKPGIQ